MPRRKWNLNAIYISERLQECLRPISHCALTTVVAPMGYGKTTAVNWYLEDRAKTEKVCIVRISAYSDNLTIFWRSVQEAFAHAGLDFLQDYPCPVDTAGGSMLTDDLCHELAGKRPCYIFIDDFHLLTDGRIGDFLCTLANRLPENVHLIVASRDRFLSAAQSIRLGGKVYRIGTEKLRLNHTELSVYAHRCGVTLTEEQLESLLYSSEGWVSAIYLNLRTISEQGILPNRHSDIYTMFTEAMIDPLSPVQREFLATMGLADEFTVEMACAVTEDANVEEILTTLTEQNAFVKRLPGTETFRFHHMMKECAERTFQTLPREKQTAYLDRFGLWYEKQGQYLHAMSAYRRSENYAALLRVMQKDAGILLSSLHPSEVLTVLDACPVSVLKEHPLAILVLMRSMFNWRQIPKMMEMKALLMTAIAEHPEMLQRERGDLLGECDLIMSFLCYNDISAMSRLHRSASAQMSRPAISIQKSGGWTFGSPSVLMMFYREPGALSKELAEMDECMPHYYKITDGHGQGAEKIMRAEASFMQGRFADAHIELESAYAQIQDNGQENMALCCDFLSWRLSLCTDIEQRYTFEQRYQSILRHHNAAWVNIWNATCAYYYALQRVEKRIPEIFREHQLSTVNILAPGKPMMEMIENQVYLAQGAYAKVIGRSEGLLAMCEGLHYALVALHLRIQTAAAYEMLGKTAEARSLLERALQDAQPDDFLMPFVENYHYLKKLLTNSAWQDISFIRRIVELGEDYDSRQRHWHEQASRPTVFAALTARECEIVALMAGHFSNREIAEKLFLSEGSVKQYINQIYQKLHIDGDTRTKRKQLLGLLPENS